MGDVFLKFGNGQASTQDGIPMSYLLMVLTDINNDKTKYLICQKREWLLEMLYSRIKGDDTVTKKLIFICGPNGVGKSSTGRELISYIENSAFVDSDLCSLRNPFINTEGIDIGRQFMLFMLTKYLESSLYETIIWTFAFHGHRKAKLMIHQPKLHQE